MKSTLQESKISLNNIHESIFPQTPPWIIKTPKVILELKEHSKTKTHPSTYLEKFYNIPITSMSLRMDPRTMVGQCAQLFWTKQFLRNLFQGKALSSQQKSMQ